MGNLVRVLTAAAIGVTALAGSVTPAQADTHYIRRCENRTGCELAISNFPGGTMSIDVDSNGSGTGHWILFKHGSLRACETDYDLQAPAQSWVCHNLGADNYVLWVAGQPSSTWHVIGARF